MMKSQGCNIEKNKLIEIHKKIRIDKIIKQFTFCKTLTKKYFFSILNRQNEQNESLLHQM